MFLHLRHCEMRVKENWNNNERFLVSLDWLSRWFSLVTGILLIIYSSLGIVDWKKKKKGVNKRCSLCLTFPGAVRNLRVESVTTSSLTVAWDAPQPDVSVGVLSQFGLRWKSKDSHTWSIVNQVSANDLSYSLPGLSADTEYIFQVSH